MQIFSLQRSSAGLDAGGPAQESFGPETTEGSLSCEETPMKNATES